MSANTSYRLSGVALLLGAALSIAYLVMQGWFLGGSDITALLGPLDVVSNEIGVVGGILLALGLPGLYARQAERAGIIGLIGFILVWYVNLIQSVLLPFANVTFVSAMNAHIIPQKVETLMTPPPVWGPFFTLSMVGEVLGMLLLAIAILRARVFPRWIGWTLIATLVLGAASFAPFVPEAVSTLVGVVANVAIGGVGVALLAQTQRGQADAEPARARATASV